VQPVAPFLGLRPPVVTKAEFEGSGFSSSHLAGVRWAGWRVPSTMIVQLRRLLSSGEPLIYAYYDGIDKVAHEHGLGEFYDAEVAFTDRLVGDVLSVMLPGCALVITSDHGQVDVGENVVRLDPSVMAHVELQSGEGRFRWLHARAGHQRALLEAAQAAHGDQAWVRSRDSAAADGWFGPRLSEAAAARLGDVLLAARSDLSFDDPADSGPFELVGRHGSLTAAEMLVPLLVSRP
jgi:hypothetical protein